MNKEMLAPLTGVALIVVVILGFAIGGEPPGADSSPEEIVDFYVDNDSSVMFGAALEGIAATLLLFFAGFLRQLLRAAEGEGHMLSAVAMAGATVIAVGLAFDATLSFALAETAEDIEPASAQTLQALWDNDFMPLAVGFQVFLLASGISILRHGALPKWLGWVAIVLGVIAITPIGFVAATAGAIWILIVGVIGALRLRPATTTA
jgi:Domain of unknown function (DUF4386)